MFYSIISKTTQRHKLFTLVSRKLIIFFLISLPLITLNMTVVRAATTDSVSLVKDILPGKLSSASTDLVNINGILYFQANDGVHGQELWKSDGTTAGTMLVKDIVVGSGSSMPSFSSPSGMIDVNGMIYFRAKNGVNGWELWKSDGTAAGTVMVKDIIEGSDGSTPFYLTNVNSTLYFIAIGFDSNELWKSDGTAAGTVMVKDIFIGYPSHLTDVNGILYFSASDETHSHELWKSDGTTTGTVMVKDINVGKGSSPEDLTDVNGTLYFTANDGAGREVWKSDGTAVGTVKLTDINTDNHSSAPSNLTNVNGTVYFLAWDELWKSDGTPAGTVVVKDISVDGGRYATEMININGTLYFRAHSNFYAGGYNLWKSDGTTAGTIQVKPTWLGKPIISPGYLSNFNGVLYFQSLHEDLGWELWKSDGTAAGTILVNDIRPGQASSHPRQLTVSGSKLFFLATHRNSGRELWSVSQSNSNENLLNNPGFESGDTQLWHVAHKTTAGVVSDPVHSGNNALALSGNPERFTSVRQTITDAIVGGHRYNLQTWLAVNGNNTGKFLLEVRWYKADGSEYKTARTKFGITRRDTSFKLQTTELVAPPKAVRMVLYLRANKADGVAYFDDLQVTDLTSNTPQLPGNQPPLANIVNISPSPVVVSNNVSFSGKGSDADGIITGYQWRSSINGPLSNELNFSTSSLLEGTHKIYFKVMDNQGLWSNEVSQSLVVSATLDQGDNLLSNADFETGDTSDWTGTRTHAKVVTTPAHEGSYALSLNGSPTGSKKLGQSVFNITGGQTYRFQGWLSVEGNSTGKFLMLVSWHDASGNEISIARRSFGITRVDSDYTEKVVDLKAPSNAVRASLLLKANKANGVGYFDDVSIRKLF